MSRELAQPFEFTTRALTVFEYTLMQQRIAIMEGRGEAANYWPVTTQLMAERLTEPERVREIWSLPLAEAKALELEMLRSISMGLRLERLSRGLPAEPAPKPQAEPKESPEP